MMSYFDFYTRNLGFNFEDNGRVIPKGAAYDKYGEDPPLTRVEYCPACGWKCPEERLQHFEELKVLQEHLMSYNEKMRLYMRARRKK
jgi:hypothetical protein